MTNELKYFGKNWIETYKELQNSKSGMMTISEHIQFVKNPKAFVEVEYNQRFGQYEKIVDKSKNWLRLN